VLSDMLPYVFLSSSLVMLCYVMLLLWGYGKGGDDGWVERRGEERMNGY